MNIAVNIKTLVFFAVSVLQCIHLHSQDTTKTSRIDFDFGMDLKSRYVWRGSDYGNAPSFQPYGALVYKNFELGVWSAFGITGSFAEKDFYASYTYKCLKLTIFDYYLTYSYPAQPGYFNFGKNTPHIIEADLEFKGQEKFPLQLLGSCNIYGQDSSWSTYFEAKYTFHLLSSCLDIFAGFTPDRGYYADYEGFVNTGFTAKKEIKITEKFSLRTNLSVMVNTVSEKVFVVFGLGV